jgi:hypothetical protein
LLDLRKRVVQTQNRAGRPGRFVNLCQHRRRGETVYVPGPEPFSSARPRVRGLVP